MIRTGSLTLRYPDLPQPPPERQALDASLQAVPRGLLPPLRSLGEQHEIATLQLRAGLEEGPNFAPPGLQIRRVPAGLDELGHAPPALHDEIDLFRTGPLPVEELEFAGKLGPTKGDGDMFSYSQPRFGPNLQLLCSIVLDRARGKRQSVLRWGRGRKATAATR